MDNAPADEFPRKRNRASWFAVFALIFILLCAAFIPYAGLEDDELFFVRPLYPAWQHVTMIATYIGSLKTQLYWPVFHIFGVSAWSVRLPMVLAATLTLWILYYLSLQYAGGFAAILSAALLATHPAFILTSTLDRGPVVLEQLLLMLGCWFLVRYGRAGDAASRRDLALGFLCFGLATWSKAVFGWALAGLAAGGLAVFGREIRRALRPANVAIAAAAFLLGALPLIIYNVRHFNATLTAGAHLEDWQALREKWIPLRNNANGSLFAEDFVSAENSASPKAPFSLRGRVAVWIREHLGEHRQTGFCYVFGALLVAVPWWWRSRAARFSLVFIAVAWMVMAATRNAGNYSAHVMLLWPFPVLFVAWALAALPWRRPALLAGIAMVAMNLLVVSQYVSQYERNGPHERFTDAIYPLSAGLPENSGRTIYCVDWNVASQFKLLHKGRLAVRTGSYPLLSESPSESDIGQIRAMVSDRDALFVAHVSAQARVFGVRLERTAESLGFHRETLRTIADSNGRPVFAVFQFRPLTQ